MTTMLLYDLCLLPLVIGILNIHPHTHLVITSLGKDLTHLLHLHHTIQRVKHTLQGQDILEESWTWACWQVRETMQSLLQYFLPVLSSILLSFIEGSGWEVQSSSRYILFIQTRIRYSIECGRIIIEFLLQGCIRCSYQKQYISIQYLNKYFKFI